MITDILQEMQFDILSAYCPQEAVVMRFKAAPKLSAKELLLPDTDPRVEAYLAKMDRMKPYSPDRLTLVICS